MLQSESGNNRTLKTEGTTAVIGPLSQVFVGSRVVTIQFEVQIKVRKWKTVLEEFHSTLKK